MKAMKSKRKYKNQKVKFDGFTFDSKKEFERYLVLKSELKTGKIQDLRLQQAFVLAPSVKLKNEPKAKPAMKYIADFVYIRDGVQVVEDVKSEATRENPVYRLKKHLMKSVNGIDIDEV